MKANKKEAFIKFNKDYQYIIKRVEDVCNQAYIFNYPKALFFINKFEKKIIIDYLNYYDNIFPSFFSNINNNEKELLVIYKKELLDNKFTTLLKISYPDRFYSINHRDILGSILALGIKRNNIGDIVKEDKYFYLEVKTDLADMIIDNLAKIGKTKIKITVTNKTITKNQEYESHQGVIKSLRLDNIVKLITKMSNNEVRDYLLGQNVKVNQLVKDDFSLTIHDDVELSLKGYGRFYLEVSQCKRTKKDNYLINYLKYI